MSGDEIKNLKMVKEQPLNVNDLDYIKRVLDPFEDVIIEKFNGSTTPTPVNQSTTMRVFLFIAITLVVVINFPKFKEKSGLNEYIIWLLTLVILFGVVY